MTTFFSSVFLAASVCPPFGSFWSAEYLNFGGEAVRPEFCPVRFRNHTHTSFSVDDSVRARRVYSQKIIILDYHIKIIP